MTYQPQISKCLTLSTIPVPAFVVYYGLCLSGCHEVKTNQKPEAREVSTARRIPRFDEIRGIEDLVTSVTQPNTEGRQQAFISLLQLSKGDSDLAKYVFGPWGIAAPNDPNPKSGILFLRFVDAVANWLDTDLHAEAGQLLYAITGIPPINRTRHDFIDRWQQSAIFKAIHGE